MDYAKFALSEEQAQIFNDNLKLVDYTLYKCFKLSTLDKCEVLNAKNVGMLGLAYAVKNYDASKPSKFTTYAVNTIRYYVMNELNNNIHPCEWDSIEVVKTIELTGKPSYTQSKVLAVDYVTPTVERIYDQQMVKYIHKTAKEILNEQYYKIYKLHYIEDKAVAEIAEIMNCTKSYVYGVLKSIQCKLRKELCKRGLLCFC